MAALFAKPVRLSLTNFVIFLNLLCLTATASTIERPRSFATKLIHRDSALSPYYNPNATIKDHAMHTLKTSVARLAYLGAKSNVFVTDDTRAGLVAEDNGAQFMASFSIGEPLVPQLLTIDTGSNLLWVQCLPCTKCFEQASPIFDPSKSSTYTTLHCNSPYCTISPSDKCDPSNNCKFSHKYLDGTDVAGLLGTEKVTLDTSDEGISPVTNVVFGCAHDNDGYNGQPSGILGLGPSNISLATQLGSKFSYCIGNMKDPKYPHNQLILGDGAKIEGLSTPLEVYNDLYYLTLEGISLSERRLEIDPEIFKRTPSGTGGTVIDSGTTLSFLAKGAYDVLRAEVQKLMDGKLEKVEEPDIPSALCYKGIISQDLVGFPDVVLNFADGAELGLDIESLFQEYGQNELCMALQESPVGNDLNVVGIMAQQFYNVAYDLAANKVYFQRIDCELLDD
ncbi:unnamed protein product [Prunus armeniaca]|uniref:Peptidase A1 domain-containing protein n=1 Tax=Prunus armeniaca TaxID=36596 RepID=A0A6J5VYH5_PRUAR|nr:unnamed protein product [Prunus armeniaca]